jgi:hypothetical protein
MPPQPISSVRSTVGVTFTPRAMEERPHLAVFIAQAIARWSSCEFTLGYILAKLLHTKAAVGMAMFESLTSTTAQLSILQAAAATTLSKREKELYDAIMVLVSAAAKQRNKLAHHVWGVSPSLPDALILADPKYTRAYYVRVDAIQRKKSKQPPEFPDFPRDKAFIYRQKDLEEVVQLIERTGGYLWNLMYVVDRDWPRRTNHQVMGREPIFRKLSNESEVQQVLSRLRERQENDPKGSKQ